MPRFARRLYPVALGLGLAMGLLPAATPAQALSDGVAFTAQDAPTWQTNGIVWALEAVGDTVFAGGTFTEIRPPAGSGGSAQVQQNFAAFNASTGEPAACRPSIVLGSTSGTVRALETSSDGSTLYIGGNFSFIGNVNVARLAALDLETCTVRPFRVPLIAGIVRDIAVTDDVVYVAGEFRSVGGQTRERFAAFDATSGALLPWRADADRFGKAVAVSPEGDTVMLGGDFFSINGQYSHSIAVVDPTTGQNLRNYGPGFIPNTSTTQAITTDETGFYVANEGTGGGVFDGKFAIDHDTLDQRWRDNCLGATQDLVIDGGTLYAAHHHHECRSEGTFQDGRRIYLSAHDAQTSEMLAWRPELNDGIGEGIGPRALTIAEGSGQRHLWTGGEFTQVNGRPQQGLTRFPSGGNEAPVTAPTQVSAESLAAGSVQVRWRTVFDPDDGLLTYTVFRDGTALGTVDAESRWWHRPQASFLDENAEPGRTYAYAIAASDGNTNSQLSTPVSVAASTTDAEYAQAVLGDGATLYWRYDESGGGYGADASPANRNPLFFRDPQFRAGSNAVGTEPGYAMGFSDGAYAYHEALAPAPQVYSIETWFQTTTASGGKLVGFGNGLPTTHNTPRHQNSSNYDRHLYMRDDGRITFGVYTGSAQTITSPGAHNDGEWHHVVATQGPGGMALYLNGELVSASQVSGAQDYLGTWRVGADNLSGWPNRPGTDHFTGSIDETAVYPTVLSAAQVAQHYQLGTREPGEPPPEPEVPPLPNDPLEITLEPGADAVVRQSSPAANFGGLTILASRGAAPQQISYLGFDLPEAPEGQELSEATLTLRTTTDPAAGSVHAHQISVAEDDPWQEHSITYQDRPGPTGTVLGQVPAGTTANAHYPVDLDPAGLQESLGATATLVLASQASNDALFVYSKDFIVSSYRPQLHLVFTDIPDGLTLAAPHVVDEEPEMPELPSAVGADGIAVEPPAEGPAEESREAPGEETADQPAEVAAEDPAEEPAEAGADEQPDVSAGPPPGAESPDAAPLQPGTEPLAFDLSPPSEPRVFAHYFPPYPISLDNLEPAGDYYSRNYLEPEGEGGRHVAYGGLLRDRPIPRDPLPGHWAMTDLLTEIDQAASAGLDGFFVDVLSFGSTNWDRTVNLFEAAERSPHAFVIAPQVDLSAIAGTATPAEVAEHMAQLADSPAAFRLVSGEFVLSAFKAEDEPPQWWAEVIAHLEEDHGVPTAFMPVFLDIADMEDYAEISHAAGNWGVRGAGAAQALPDYAAAARALGLEYIAPVAVQDSRPNQSVFWEASNLATLRATWQRAIDDRADYVVINTWNDYSENTSIAPSVSHGHNFLDVSAYYAEWFRTGSPAPITRDALYLTHRTQPADAEPELGHRQMEIRSADRDPAQDTVEVHTFLRERAEVSVQVGASTYRYMAAAGVDHQSFPLEPGEVAVRAERDGAQVGAVTSPFEVTDSPQVEDLQYVAAGSRR